MSTFFLFLNRLEAVSSLSLFIYIYIKVMQMLGLSGDLN